MVSGYSTLVGFAKAASTNNATFTTVANWAKGLTASSTYDCATTVYQIDKKTERVEPSFSLSDSATGSITWVSATRYYGTKTTHLRPTSASAAGTSVSHGAISSTPTTATAKLPYGAEFVGWSTSETSMSTVTPTTENTWYYAVYRSSVTHYYYNSGWTTRTIYRNIFDGNGTGANGSGYYKAVFSTTTTGTSNNVTDPNGPGGSTLDYITSYLGDPENDKEVYALRPMTCPFQYQVFLNRGRSYRDLPMRLNETSTLFRNEASGEMHGLIRVRQFTISEGHLMCTPEQLEGEFKHCLELANYMLETLGLREDVSYRFSQWDPDNREKYTGTDEQWAEAQGMMEKILNDLGVEYKIGIGEAAFYGPKLDIQIKNVHGKEDTLITIQIDPMIAEKFGMEYTDKDGTKKNPYIIHRTSIGCYERTLALLIEKYAGAFPTWLAPVQVKLLPIADRHLDFVYEVKKKLEEAGIWRIEVDDRSEKLGYKLREAQLEKVPYMLVIGDKDVEAGTVSVRSRKEGDKGAMNVDEFIKQIKEEIDNKVR